MYRLAEETINQGLGFGVRVLLGVFSSLFGLMMILTAPSSAEPFLTYLFGAFCFLITGACFTWGRIRQFFGSLIGLNLFVMSLLFVGWLVLDWITGDEGWFDGSLIGGVFFLAFFGWPGLSYAMRAKFGLGAERELHLTADSLTEEVDERQGHVHFGSGWKEHEGYLVGDRDGLIRLNEAVGEALEKGESLKGAGEFSGVRRIDPEPFDRTEPSDTLMTLVAWSVLIGLIGVLGVGLVTIIVWLWRLLAA